MIARVAGLLSSARAWLILGMLLPRASGFLTGLILARTGGAAAVGLYSTVMNTASPLVAPLSHTMINNNTLMASQHQAEGLRGLWRAQGLLLLGAFAIGLPAFLWLFARGTTPETLAGNWGWALLGAAAVFLSQFGTPMMAALLHGEGRFREAGQWAVVTGAVGLLGVLPVVWFFGLPGAITLAAVTALLGWSLLSRDLLQRHRRMPPGGSAPIFREIFRRLRAALPAMFGMGLNGAVNWLCTIYLTHAQWGTAGVGLIGIGLQWSTLMLIPATSWGGMALKSLDDALRGGERTAIAAALRNQIRRNALITALAAGVVVAGSGLLEHAYGLPNSGLRTVLLAFAAAAVVSSINIVFEKFWWAAGRQVAWFAWSCVALASQVTATVLLLEHHPALAAFGVLIYGAVLALCSLATLPGLLSHWPFGHHALTAAAAPVDTSTPAPSEPVSIVIPLYNKAGTIENTVGSVLQQTVRDFELLVIDDGSTDDGSARVAAIADERIRLHRQPNAGVSAARNRGVALARHDLIAFLDADDLWAADHLANLLELRRRHPDAALYACAYLMQAEDGRRRPVRLRSEGLPEGHGLIDDYFLDSVEIEHPVHVSGMLVERDRLAAVGGFPQQVHLGEDLLTVARLACLGPLAYSSRATMVYLQPPVSERRAGAALRSPQQPDPVAPPLRDLQRQYPAQALSIARYLGGWHRIRAMLFLELGERRACLQELQLALRESRPRLRDLASLALLTLPMAPRRQLLSVWRRRIARH